MPRYALKTALFTAMALLGMIMAPGPAPALPSFARQTGFPCALCHTTFPELTAYGRAFKLNGYVWGGGDEEHPHVAAMVLPSFTNTEKGQPPAAAPHFGENDNFALDAASLFYGGQVWDKIGAFLQVTYDGIGRRLSIDNTDIRFADSRKVADGDLVYGVTLNNNPTVSDIYNTTPAWGFPYASSGLAPEPAASTLIEGALATQVGGAGTYAMYDDTLYVEAAIYQTMWKAFQTGLGIDTSGESDISGAAPYWRAALQHNWDEDYFSLGTFGMYAALRPSGMDGAGTDKFTDIGVDLQYQHLDRPHEVTFQTSFIHENQNWDASFPMGGTANPSDVLETFKAKTTYDYDRTYAASAGYFSIFGDSDMGLYAPGPISGSLNGSPNSNGFIFELDYMPFSWGGPEFWPWLNAKLSLQYVAYTEFNGASSNYDGFGRDASDNNTLYLSAWLAF